jgi:hypothetical protein
MAISSTSRYYNATVDYIQLEEGANQNPVVFYNFTDFGKLSAKTYVYEGTGTRLDQIAMEQYNKPQLWYLIAEFNPQIKDPMNIAPGTEILIPNV